ncbi:MAG TPA: hypothetical protein VFX80_03305 [Solirubrobacteraceae bacterium]|nr:hypothetical protein [Solirubrobacteraceae bacterium]
MRGATVLLAMAALAATAADASAKPGTFAGSLGIKVPKGAQADVRAVNRATGTVTAARPVGRTGRFSLSLAPATYLVVGTVVTKQGKLVQKRIGVSLKSGQKRKRTSLAAPKRKRRRGRARPAFVQELGNLTPGRIAVEIPNVTGSTGNPDWDAFKGGINDVLMNDVFEARRDCGTTLIEVDRRADLIKELEFQQSPYVDPSTRVTRNLILGDVELRGSISRAAGDRAKVTMTIVDKRTGKTLGGRETTLASERWSDQLETFGKQLADDLCKLSDVYEVTLDVTGEGRFATHSGTGAIHTTLRARRNEPGREVWRATGPLQWAGVGFATKIGCPLIDYVIPTISWSVTILDAGEGQLQVTWTRDGNDGPTASVDCPPGGPGDPDPAPVPGMPGVALLTTGPEAFNVPYTGGVQALSGVVSDGTDGFFNSGSITVTPAGVG